MSPISRGLPSFVVAAVLSTAAAAQGLVTQKNIPLAMAQTKAIALKSAWGGLGGRTFDALVEAHARKRQTPEAAEGLASFAEKRAARWSRK